MRKCIICGLFFLPRQNNQSCCSFNCRIIRARKRANERKKRIKELSPFGKKSEEYPYGYGYCQFGCGRKVKLLSSGIPLKYCKRHKGGIGKIVEGYEKGWGLCQCGCGGQTNIVLEGKRLIARRYIGNHFTKSEKYLQLVSERLKTKRLCRV